MLPDVNFDVNSLTADRAVELNRLGQHYGRLESVFLELLRIDQKEQKEAAQIREIDKAKNALSGRHAKADRARLKSQRAQLLSKFSQNEEAAKAVLGLLKRQRVAKKQR